MNENKINAAIQLLPVGDKESAWIAIERAIDLISKSGLYYKVCPFETVVEGTLPEIVRLIENIRDKCYELGSHELIINLKLHLEEDKNIFISDKMKNYENS